MVKMLVVAALSLATLLAAPAVRADYPNDVSLSSLELLPPAQRQLVFNELVRESSMALAAGRGLLPADSLGFSGFEIGLETPVAFIHTEETPGAAIPNPWQAVLGDDGPLPIWVMPTIRVRKGLPYSFEVGFSASYILLTRQVGMGGYGRWVFAEGWDPFPNVALTVGYVGYVGNDELDLGVLETDITLGYDISIGRGELRLGRLQPFVSYGFLQSHARPKNLNFELQPVTAWDAQAVAGTDTRAFRYHKFTVGMSTTVRRFVFAIDGEFTVPRGVHSVNMRFGAEI